MGTEVFGESVAPTAAIRAILGSYPFSIGLLREILQNSDDARATKQIFKLDRRYHGTETLYCPYLAAAQGPALLAFNDGLIKEEDWKALQNIHSSSKKTDTSKIGKYGIGFRSCYHVTDNPHILSGSHLAILDAKYDFATGGVKMNIEKDSEKYRDHLAAFDSFLPRNEWGKHFNGTIFRFPLRTSPGDISSKTITPDEISDLLKDFALEELNVSLLFLRNISSVEIYEIGTDGKETCIATSTIRRTPPQSYGQYEIQKVTVETHRPGNELEEREWRVLHAPFSESEAIETLSQRLGCNPSTTLSQHKLIPTIDLAIPLGAENSTEIGRLFTFLPLPLRTGFPVHINGLFSLTQSRQNLRNGGEVGIVKNSDDHALIEWNRMLFDTYIPQAWAHLLEVLVKEVQVRNIFDAWPRPQAQVDSGDYVYWKDMPQQVMKYALDLCVWPVSGTTPCMHESASRLIFAVKSTSDHDLAALVHTGLLITRPPEYLTDVIGRHYTTQVTVLSPQVAHSKLLELHDKLTTLDDSDAQVVLSYLLSTGNCRYIVGLPLVPLVSQGRVSLKEHSIWTRPLCLFDEVLEDLFTRFDSNAVSLKRLPPDVRDILVEQGCRDLDLTPVQVPQIITYLKASPYASDIHRMMTVDEIDWLNKFWDWVRVWKDGSVLYDQLSPFYLVPVTRGLQNVVTPVFDAAGDGSLVEVLELLAVPLIDTRLGTKARKALQKLKPASDIHAILRALPLSIDVSLTEEQAQYLSSYLIKALPTAHAVHGSLQNDVLLRSRLRALPIYPVITLSGGGVPSTSRKSVNAASVVRGVNLSEIPILPQVKSLIYLDLQLIDRDILQYLDPNHRHPLTLNEAQNTMLDNFKDQSFETQVAFVKYLNMNSSVTSRKTLDRLADERFVPAKDGSLRAPKDLTDPTTPLAPLYPGSSSSLPDSSRPLAEELISHLRALKLLIAHLSIDIVRERVRFIADSPHPASENVACALIALINSTRLDCRRLFDSPGLSAEIQWIPTPEGLKGPQQCRDRFSHSGKTYLFDEVFPLVKPGLHIGPNLQSAFKWDEHVTVETLSQQLVKVLGRDEVSQEKVHKIVEELGSRHLLKPQLSAIQQLLKDREWVPTRNGSLTSTSCALLGSQELPAVGLHSVVFSSSLHGPVISFLRRMGCRDEPSKETILERLEVLYNSGQGRVQDSAIIKGAIRLLEWLPTLSSTERLQLFIPDVDGVLRGFGSVCYNDLGERAYLVDIGGRTLVHPEINDNLARQLGIQRLGLVAQEASDVDPGLDMGEDLMTTIRNRLREYTHSQLLLEFLANASDAGATEFNVLLDEKKSPVDSILSPRCASFQSAPALVVHNNGVFTNDDFNGILRTGVGGKTGREDTIGQFGLGALTMFHVTEFAMIVSGDQVLFLNPCKAHLPVGRASLRVPLARMRKLYSDHLSPLLGLFGFGLPEDPNEHYFYNGTLFRLPLRSNAQFEAETIFRTVVSFSDVVSHFESVAPKCLLFTHVSNIKLLDRKDHEPRLLWSIAATREGSSQIKGADAHTVSISGTAGVFEAQDWRIMSFSVQEQLPSFTDSLRQKYRLRMPPVARIAACLSSVDAKHDLFSTLPLPISLELPVHVSASFILASDRRSVRLDEYENIEASYNRWLLTTVVPQLYLRLLEDRAAVSDNANYWPGNSALEGSRKYSMISTLVMNAVYQMAAVSDAPIFRSCFHDCALSPRAAHLSYRLCRPVRKVLDANKPQDLVLLPSPITLRLKGASTDDGYISTVQPKYVQTQMLDNDSNFDPSTLKLEELQALVDYQIQDGFDPLLGLRLLPLEDGTISRFTHSSESCFFVASSSVLKRSVFKAHRLVHRDLDTTKLLESKQLNVKEISDANIKELLNDYLSESPTLENASPETCSWIEQFWKAFKHLQITHSTIAKYPLVPTLEVGVYVSISHCGTPSVVLADFTRMDWLSRCFTQMGFLVVDTAHLSRQIKSGMKPSSLDIESVSSALFGHPTRSLGELFGALDSKSHLALVAWIGSQLSVRNEKYFRRNSRLKTLPIWQTVENLHVSAHEVQMLPSNISLESVAPFSSGNVVEYKLTLKKMGIEPHSSVRSLLQLPEELEPQMDQAYERLIRALMIKGGLGSLPVPDSERVIAESNTLYSSQDDLFLAAFGPDSDYFILPSFRHLEDRLDHYGLKRQRNLNKSMFKECAEAFQEDFGDSIYDEEDEELRRRAAIIFRVYAEDLPLRSLSSEEWKELDKLRFVPRDINPKPLGEDISIEDYVASWVGDADIVSPSGLVRPDLSAIAWSQRALYNADARLCVFTANPGLSVPTAEEVVNHLVVLATKVARHHPRNELVLSHIEQTYKWLNEHSDEAQPFLDRYRQKTALFLNVKNPKTDDWSWVSGGRIWLETYDAAPYSYARRFLESFRNLLIAAGAININHPDLELAGQARENHPVAICRSFDDLRREGICTDAHFTFKGEEPLRAHRSFLAAYCSHFKDMFSSSFSEAGAASAAGPIQISVSEWSRRCVELVLDYAYTGEEPDLSREDVAVALEALRLMHLWSMSKGHEAVQNVVMKSKMVNPSNVDQVQATAEQTNATTLLIYCNKYKSNNDAAIRVAQQVTKPKSRRK